MAFSFEKLDTYKKAVKMAEAMEALSRRLKGKVSYSFIDQLSRASMSVPLNLAEGNGRWHKNEKRQFFWIARGSVFEIVPILQIGLSKRVIAQDEYQHLYNQLQELSVMILRLIQSVEKLNGV